MISKIFIAAQGSFPTSMLLLGRRRARMRPRAFGAYERFAEGKTSAQAEFISAEHSNHFRGIRGALAPHGTGPTIMGPMISKMFIAAQGSFLYFHAVVGPSSGGAHPVEDVHSMWISLLCQGETARQGCRALQLTGSACQIVKRALQLIRDGGQVMSVRKKALDREGCFYYALALGIDLGRLSTKG